MQTLSEKLARFRDTHPPRRIRCGDADWRYFAGGSGKECILFLHGGGGTGEMFFDYFLELEDTYRVLAPSLPPEVTTVAGAIKGLASILDADAVAAPHIFGHSLGGFLAMEFSERLPERVKTLMLSSTYLPSPEHARKIERQLRLMGWVPNSLLNWTVKLALKRTVRLAGTSISQEQASVLLSFVPLDDAAALRRTVASASQLHRDYHRHPPGDARWKGPVMIFETGRDRIVMPADLAALRSRYPNAEIRRFEDAGHLDVMTNPLWFVRDIRSFLASN